MKSVIIDNIHYINFITFNIIITWSAEIRVRLIHPCVLYAIKYGTGGCPRGVMVKAMDCGVVVREFVLQSRYYVHFRTNTLEKGMNPLILPAMG